MINAGIDAGSDQAKYPSFLRFQFVFATALLHEIGGHLLVTFLGHGKKDTPVKMGALGYNKPGKGKRIGESGRYLEMQLFGGTLEYYQGPNQNMHDVRDML